MNPRTNDSKLPRVLSSAGLLPLTVTSVPMKKCCHRLRFGPPPTSVTWSGLLLAHRPPGSSLGPLPVLSRLAQHQQLRDAACFAAEMEQLSRTLRKHLVSGVYLAMSVSQTAVEILIHVLRSTALECPQHVRPNSTAPLIPEKAKSNSKSIRRQ